MNIGESKESPVMKAAKAYSEKVGFSGSLPKAFIAGAKWKQSEDNKRKIATINKELRNESI